MLEFRNIKAKYFKVAIMLKIITPNNEMANLIHYHVEVDCFSIQFDAVSDDFRSDVVIQSRYAIKERRPYHVFFFCRNNLSENNIYNICDKKTNERIGLISPIRSFCTLEHSWAEDAYFEIVAGAMFWHLIDDEQNVSITPLYREEYNISDFYDENLAVLIVNKNLMPDFDINGYLPTLFSYGFSLCKPGKTLSHSWKFRDLPQGKSIKIYPVTSICLEDGYIESLYKDLLPFEGNVLAQFMLQYQVFEMLMHLVFKKRIDEVKAQITDFSGAVSDLRDVLEKIGKITKERDRIKGSIDDSSLSRVDTGNLVDSCNQLLSGQGSNVNDRHCADIIYDVRNLIFHNFRSIPEGKRGILSDINSELMRIIPKLLIAN
jgi:hypothetical protein